MWVSKKGRSGMNHQEALDELECYSIQWVVNYMDNEKADKMLNHSKLLQQLIDEKIERESRKDKLIVGSEWECVVRCNGMSFSHVEGTIVKIKYLNYDAEVLTTPLTELENYLDPWGEYVDIDEVFTTSQFLLCFKPIKVEVE
jgi:hypothetical protein